MSATIYEGQIPEVIDLLEQYRTLDPSKIPQDLTPDEIALIAKRREDELLRKLMNRGILVRKDPSDEPSDVLRATP